MSRQFRYRMAALVASGLIFGVPLLTNGTASADQLEPGDRRVTFDGGVLGLSCGSRPNVEKLSVPAESTLHLVNRTGHDARLELAGKPRGVIPEDGTAEVLFRRGTTPVVLTPDCSGSDDPLPMLVTAVPSTPSTFADPSPDDADATTLPSIVAGGSGPSASGSALPASGSSRFRTAHPGQSSGHHRSPDDRAARAGASGDAAAETHKDKVKDRVSRTAEARDPAFAGMPPGGRRTTLLPADSQSTGVAAADTVPLSSASADSAAFPQVDDVTTAPAAEPVAAIEPMRTGRPIGLLGLTAMVCALGVLTAAIRAIVSQRASRANLA
ncbi:hypothetical protein [Actinoplanes sp. HUAS TT8]|uniref:hypothetical protein n=1 Tax=Actinoplanes sp. HUAS TT8 TaxID=3447453 RepID=UPI003F528968